MLGSIWCCLVNWIVIIVKIASLKIMDSLQDTRGAADFF